MLRRPPPSSPVLCSVPTMAQDMQGPARVRSHIHCSCAAPQVMHITSGAPPAVVFTPQANQVVDGIATAPSRRATFHSLQIYRSSAVHTLM